MPSARTTATIWFTSSSRWSTSNRRSFSKPRSGCPRAARAGACLGLPAVPGPRANQASMLASRRTAECHSRNSPAVGASSYAWWWAARDSPSHDSRASAAASSPANRGSNSSCARIEHPAAEGNALPQYSSSADSRASRVSRAQVRGQCPSISESCPPRSGDASSRAAASSNSAGSTGAPVTDTPLTGAVPFRASRCP
jgi:hypothetical protein